MYGKRGPSTGKTRDNKALENEVGLNTSTSTGEELQLLGPAYVM
jgi:hypothetical protein